MGLYIIIAAFAILALPVSCSKIDRNTGSAIAGQVLAGDNSIVLNISEALPSVTKSNDDINMLTGSKFEKLRVWLVSGGTVVKYWAGDYASGSEKMQETVQLNEVARATYDLYVLANSNALDSYTEGRIVDATFTDMLLDSYDYTTYAMPLSYNGKISVLPGVNSISVKVLRTSARYSLKFINHTHTKNIIITKARLSAFKPEQTYIFNHDYEIPYGTLYGSFPDIPMTTVTPQGSVVAFDQFMFEGMAHNYSLEIAGGVFDKSVTVATGDNTIGNTEVPFDNTNKFFIVNNGNWYLGIVNGVLKAVQMTDSQLFASKTITDFLWTFTNPGNNYAKNIATGQYISSDGENIRLTTSVSGYMYKFVKNKGEYDYFDSGKGRRYIDNDNGTISGQLYWTLPNRKKWMVRKSSLVFGAGNVVPDKTFRRIVELNYIDKYGAVGKLLRIRRNEHIGTAVNLYYNADTGTFFYEVENWIPVSGETTFN